MINESFETQNMKIIQVYFVYQVEVILLLNILRSTYVSIILKENGIIW